MTGDAPARARQDDYLRWRQRIADKQAARRQPQETPTKKPNSTWDPEVLFRGDEPSGPAPDEGVSREQTIDLRDGAEAPVTPEPFDSTTSPRPRHDAQPSRSPEPNGARPDAGAGPMAPRRDPRKQRLDSVMARLQGSTRAPEPATTEAAEVDAPHDDPLCTTIDLRPIAERLRELNQLRLDCVITDQQFNARKAELFDDASRR